MIERIKQEKGFTLIELLTVVIIIGILAGLITVSVSSARSQARDSARKSDLNTLKTALELYYGSNNQYPASTCYIFGNNLYQSLSPYLSGKVGDPIVGTENDSRAGWINYQYVVDASEQTSYALFAKLERPKPEDLATLNNKPNIAPCQGAPMNYKLTN